MTGPFVKLRGRGEQAYNAKLTKEKVLWMRTMRDVGHSYRECAEYAGVSLSTARDVVNYLTWRHVG